MPDFCREGAAEDLDPVHRGHFNRVRLRVADPDHGRQVRLVAGKPGVGEAVRRPRLARLARAAGVGRGPRAFDDVVVQEPGHLVGDRFGDHPFGVGRFGPVDLAAGEDDAIDRDRVVVDPARGERRVCVRHLEWGHPDAEPTDPLGGDPVEGAGYPHRLRRLGDRFGPDVEVELGEDRVVGGDRRLLEVDRAQVSLVGGVDFPVAPFGQVEVERLRGVIGRVGVDPLLDRRGQDEGLEGRAGLAVALGGEVELAAVVGGAGDHRPNVPVARVDRDECRGGVGRVGEGRAHRFKAHLL